MTMHLLPEPRSYTAHSGVYSVSGAEIIALVGDAGPESCRTAGLLGESVRAAWGVTVPVLAAQAPRAGCITLETTSGFGDEGYRLAIAPDRIHIGASAPRGLLWGVRTLEQVLMQAGTSPPCMTIEDAPDIARRGFLYDASRGRVPTLATMQEIVDTASRFKMNEVQFYVEHVFAFLSHPDIWRGQDVITPADMTGLDAYARERGVDLVPCLASFGHMYDILQNPAYSQLCELADFDPSGDSRWWNRMIHHTIDVSNPATYRFLGELFDDFLPCFGSRYFNICCDETVDLGTGRTRALAEREGVGALYLGHILRLHEMAARHGRQVMLWGDILAGHPELIGRLPKDVILLNWEYGGTVKPDGTRMFADSGRPFYSCPGIWGWSKLMNTIDRACGNVGLMAGYAHRFGARGVLTTEWGDFGHINTLAAGRHGFVYGAARSWNVAGSDDDAVFDRAVSLLAFGDDSERTGPLMRELAGLYTYWRRMILGIGGLTLDELDSFGITDTLLARSCRRGREIADMFEDIARDVPQNRRIDLAELAWSARAVAMNARTAMWAKQRIAKHLTASDGPALRGFAGDMHDLSDEFAALWRQRSRESELSGITGVLAFIAREAEILAG